MFSEGDRSGTWVGNGFKDKRHEDVWWNFSFTIKNVTGRFCTTKNLSHQWQNQNSGNKMNNVLGYDSPK